MEMETSLNLDKTSITNVQLGEVYWTFNIAYLSVQVEIIELDTDNRIARTNRGWISFDRLYESEDKCLNDKFSLIPHIINL